MADSAYSVEVTDANFATTVLEQSHQVPVLVDFWAEWCQPCKMLMPTLAKLAEEYAGKFILAKVNTEEQKEVAGQFGIRSIPTVKLFIGGQPVDEFAGALPESAIRDFLDHHLPRESDGVVQQAMQLMDQEDLSGAASLIEEALQQDPNNPAAIIANAQLKILTNDFDAAEQTLDSLSPEQKDDPDAVQLRAQLPFLRIYAQAPPMEGLTALVEAGNADSHAQYQLAAHLVYQQQFEQALEILLGLMRSDREYGDDAARKGMLSIFELLGGGAELVQKYRSKLFAMLH